MRGKRRGIDEEEVWKKRKENRKRREEEEEKRTGKGRKFTCYLADGDKFQPTLQFSLDFRFMPEMCAQDAPLDVPYVFLSF